MQVGCGVYELTIHGRSYVYFWHYETKAGRRTQVKEYVGPAESPQTVAEARRRSEAYYVRMAGELERMRRAAMAAIGTSR